MSEWIFPSLLEPEKPTSPRAAYYRLKVILKKEGLPDIRFHDLRHTFATHALASGVDAKTLAGILGHTNVNPARRAHSARRFSRGLPGKKPNLAGAEPNL